jgi:hypothetical protein
MPIEEGISCEFSIAITRKKRIIFTMHRNGGGREGCNKRKPTLFLYPYDSVRPPVA